MLFTPKVRKKLNVTKEFFSILFYKIDEWSNDDVPRRGFHMRVFHNNTRIALCNTSDQERIDDT